MKISKKYGGGINFALAGTGARDMLAGKMKVSELAFRKILNNSFKLLLEAAGKEMGYPGSLSDAMIRECTFRHEKPFEGFGKHRPLALASRGSQSKRAGEKIGLCYDLGGCGLKVRHLWIIMLAFARDARLGMKERPTPQAILDARAAEIGCDHRNSDKFITEMN